MNHIPLNLLNSFVVFNQAGNMTEAAKTLGITQPALSKQLAHLEQQLGQPLFQLVGRKKTLTAFGKDLNSKIKDQVENIQLLVQQTRKLHLDGISTSTTISGRREILDRLSSRLNFNGTLIFNEASREQTIEAVLNMKADIGISHNIPDTFELRSKPLFKEEFQLVIPKKLFRRKPSFEKTLFTELLSLPCIGYRPNDEVIKEACGFSNSEMKNLKMIRTTENYASLSKMVNSQKGWSVIPSHFEVSESETWTLKVPSKIIPTREFFLIYRPELISRDWFKKLILEIQSCF